MTNCEYYERDDVAFKEYHSYMRSLAAEGQTVYFEEVADMPCANYCKHYAQHGGFPGETLYCCEHPKNKKIIDAVSAFDGVDDPVEINRILDAVV